MDRYSCQIILPEIGRSGQDKLRRARVLCVGAGGLGSPALLYLASAGVGHIGIVDHDRVSLSNLQRQILFASSDIGALKAIKAAERLRALNEEIDISAYAEALTEENALSFFSNFDIVIDATDTFSAKFLINKTAAKCGLPVVYGSVSGFEGYVSVFWAKHSSCYRCLQPHPPLHAGPACAETGVIGAVAGIIGSRQALETIKLIVGLKTLMGHLYIYDAISGESRQVEIPKKNDCPVCHEVQDEIQIRHVPAEAAAALAVTEISWQQAAQNQALQYVDVREAYEWQSGHIEGAIHLPLSELKIKADMPDGLRPDQAYALYCAHGVRSLHAAELLQSHGVRTVYSVRGGLAAR